MKKLEMTETIMAAIHYSMHVEKEENPAGIRRMVEVIVFSGCVRAGSFVNT